MRIRGSVGSAEGVSGITVLGLPAAETAKLRGWRDDFSGDSRTALVSALTPAADAAVKGIPLGSRLRFDAGAGRRLTPGNDRDAGRAVRLRGARTARRSMPSTHFDRALPRGGCAAGSSWRSSSCRRGSSTGERMRAVRSPAPSGSAASTPQAWLGEGGVKLRPAGDGVELAYRINQENDAGGSALGRRPTPRRRQCS